MNTTHCPSNLGYLNKKRSWNLLRFNPVRPRKMMCGGIVYLSRYEDLYSEILHKIRCPGCRVNIDAKLESGKIKLNKYGKLIKGVRK